jgi:hypothetical protein
LDAVWIALIVLSIVTAGGGVLGVAVSLQLTSAV